MKSYVKCHYSQDKQLYSVYSHIQYILCTCLDFCCCILLYLKIKFGFFIIHAQTLFEDTKTENEIQKRETTTTLNIIIKMIINYYSTKLFKGISLHGRQAYRLCYGVKYTHRILTNRRGYKEHTVLQHVNNNKNTKRFYRIVDLLIKVLHGQSLTYITEFQS